MFLFNNFNYIFIRIFSIHKEKDKFPSFKILNYAK